MREIYTEENFDALARLLVKAWRPTDFTDNLFEGVERAKYLAGNNRQGFKLVVKVTSLISNEGAA